MIFSKFFQYLKKRFLRYFEKNTKSRILVAILMLMAVGFLAVGIYFFVREGLTATIVEEDPFIAQATPLYVYQLFFLIIGFLIFASSTIFGLFNFFKKEKERWIMSSPSYDSFGWYKFFRAVLDSSWPIVILALPLILAMRSVFSLGVISTILALLATILFSFFASGFAVVLIFLFSILLEKLKIKSFKPLASIMGIICVAVGIMIWRQVIAVDLEEIFQVEEAVSPALDAMKESFAVFPSHLPSMTLFSLQEGNLEAGLRWTGKTSGVFLAVLLLFAVVKSKFLTIWQSFQEGSFEAKPEASPESKPLKATPKSAKDVPLKKEMLSTFRSGRNLFWLAFLGILMVAQIGVIMLLDRYIIIGQVPEIGARPLTSGLQFGVIMFFINAFILRFVFPSFSEEGDTGWIIGSAPLKLTKIFTGKYYFYTFLLAVVGLLALGIYLTILPVPLETGLLTAILTLIGVATLTMVGLSMGTIFANFKTNDPQRLSTSGPGIGFTLFSILYSVLGAYLIYQTLLAGNLFLPIGFLIISILIWILFYRLSLKSLENLEFI